MPPKEIGRGLTLFFWGANFNCNISPQGVGVNVHACVCVPCCLPADILDRVSPKLEEWGLSYECVGGGRIQHDSANKKLFVYGYSMVRGLWTSLVALQFEAKCL